MWLSRKPDRSVGMSLVLCGLGLFLLANFMRQPRLMPETDISVATPIPLQLAVAMGDRYLAANISVWRVLMTGAKNLPGESLAAQAKVQEDASFLNPGHEDNYVTATATLPWEGFVQQTQTILRRATEVRKNDPYAPFFYGFNQIYFLGDAVGAYEYGQIAARQATDDKMQTALTVISAAWSERGSDPEMSIRIIAGLADSVRDPGLKSHLMQRMERQKLVADLQRKVDRYRAQHSKIPADFQQMISGGFLSSIPQDPLGTVVFSINPKSGKIFFSPKQ